jgi:hypothetical protein
MAALSSPIIVGNRLFRLSGHAHPRQAWEHVVQQKKVSEKNRWN